MTRGRRLVLAVGAPVLLVLIGWATLNVVALAGQANFPVRDRVGIRGGQVTAQINSGNITLRQAAGPGRTAELTGTAHYSLFRPTIRISGSTVGNCYLNATLRVPGKTAVSLSTFGGDVTIPSFAGSGLTVLTDGGDLTAGHLGGHLDLNTGGGDLTAAALDGQVQVNTGGGGLRVTAMRAPTASIQSGGGDIWLVYATGPGSLQIDSGGGNVTLVVPSGQYNVNLNSDGGGQSNALGSDPRAAKSITVDSEGGNIAISAGS